MKNRRIMKNNKPQGGHSEEVIKDYMDRSKRDYDKLPLEDRKTIDKIDELLKTLSEEGKEYWETYYT